MTLDGEDVTDTPLDFSGKGALSGLRIVLTDKLTMVSGRVIYAVPPVGAAGSETAASG